MSSCRYHERCFHLFITHNALIRGTKEVVLTRYWNSTHIIVTFDSKTGSCIGIFLKALLSAGGEGYTGWSSILCHSQKRESDRLLLACRNRISLEVHIHFRCVYKVLKARKGTTGLIGKVLFLSETEIQVRNRMVIKMDILIESFTTFLHGGLLFRGGK